MVMKKTKAFQALWKKTSLIQLMQEITVAGGALAAPIW